jgi:transcriptional regulator with XRE-family HTH domain
MRTAFDLIRERCGLSQREAADFLSVSVDTIKSWASGRNLVPPGVIAQLRGLHGQIDRSAHEAAARISALHRGHGTPDLIELGLSASDDEAKTLGWPCVGTHAALLGRIAALIDAPVAIVPR